MQPSYLRLECDKEHFLETTSSILFEGEKIVFPLTKQLSIALELSS